MSRLSLTTVAAISLLAIAVYAHRFKQDGMQPAEIDVVAPKLVGTASNWRNTNGKKVSIKKGRVTVVDFFTFG